MRLSDKINRILLASRFKVGSRVSWSGPGLAGHGTVKKVYTRTARVKIDNQTVERLGTPDDPALLIQSDDGHQFLKLSSEVSPSI